ncbi:zinc finger, CCHC-type containing protein [Tanacetum coccineum]
MIIVLPSKFLRYTNLVHGFDQHYTTWKYHGEPTLPVPPPVPHSPEHIDMDAFFEDISANNVPTQTTGPQPAQTTGPNNEFEELLSSLRKKPLIKELQEYERSLSKTLLRVSFQMEAALLWTIMIYLLEVVCMGGVRHGYTLATVTGCFHLERILKKIKNYVRNKAKPEGSFAEGYVEEESINFCSTLFKDDVETRFNRLGRNDDGLPDEEPNNFQVFRSACKLTGRMKASADFSVRQAVGMVCINNSPDVVADFLLTEIIVASDDLRDALSVIFGLSVTQVTRPGYPYSARLGYPSNSPRPIYGRWVQIVSEPRSAVNSLLEHAPLLLDTTEDEAPTERTSTFTEVAFCTTTTTILFTLTYLTHTILKQSKDLNESYNTIHLSSYSNQGHHQLLPIPLTYTIHLAVRADIHLRSTHAASEEATTYCSQTWVSGWEEFYC